MSFTHTAITFFPVGDCGVSAIFGNAIKPITNMRIRKVMHHLTLTTFPGIVELIPAYCSLLVQYDPLVCSYSAICKIITKIDRESEVSTRDTFVRIVEIPTVYGSEFGKDLSVVAHHTGLKEDEVVQLHSSTDYLVYMLGFVPGFPYLGGMNPRLETPRLATPRSKILAGSVGIAGIQTGIYPSDSPGGWQIIGRTPLIMYDEKKEPPALLSAGDYVRYIPINKENFDSIKNNITAYNPVVHICKEIEIREYR